MRPLGVDDGEHLAADAEYEVAAPFDVFGDRGQPQAERPDSINRHGVFNADLGVHYT
jgi:hypothetical protein